MKIRQQLASRRVRWIGAVVCLTLVAGAATVAYSATPSPAIQTITPRSANDITNLDVLRQQIRNYYGDPLGTGVFSPDSNYAHEAEDVAADGAKYLADRSDDHGSHGHGPKKGPHGQQDTGIPAIVLDVDDTTLATWNYEIASDWDFNVGTNTTAVLNQTFPAVPGMVAMVDQAKAEGYAIFFLTGRGASQHAATLGNLGHDGIGMDADYPAPTQINATEDGLFTKPAVADYPAYLQTACAADPNGSCTTSDYKTATRAHIEAEGYDIVANFGDQFSDLVGGYADQTFKMPNPNYFLP
ncbi:MAG TPA: HAD family acid phosphatase [Gaiellaceae bacterium]|jgi:hypothetical protein|nr:HAD family acid phosphatase [Gaiellaceae bacterium]